MMKKLFNNIKDLLQKRISRPFKGDESRFILSTAIKVTTIPLVVCIFIGLQIWIMVRLDLIYFQSLMIELTNFADIYYDFIFSEIIDYLPVIGLFFVALFFVGAYLGELLLRPFESLGDYCMKSIDREEAIYDPEMFSDLRLLTRFSDFFFTSVSSGREQGQIRPCKIPQVYSGIHKPFFDKVFFLHFCLFLCVLIIITSVFTLGIAVDLHENIVEFAITTLRKKDVVISTFLNRQSEIFSSVIMASIVFLIVSYSLMALHLYGRVSDAAFGIFATMRSFLKGQFSSRVHMIGHRYLRTQTRAINKYLEFLQTEYTGDRNDQL